MCVCVCVCVCVGGGVGGGTLQIRTKFAGVKQFWSSHVFEYQSKHNSKTPTASDASK